VSKLSGLKVLKLSKMAKRLGMDTISRNVSRDSWTSIPGVESLGGLASFPSHGVSWQRIRTAERALIPELTTLRPASFGTRAADSDVNGFFVALAQQDSSKALISVKKNLTCQLVWISFLIIIKRERLNGRSQ
jgi:hypothetical protein